MRGFELAMLCSLMRRWRWTNSSCIWRTFCCCFWYWRWTNCSCFWMIFCFSMSSLRRASSCKYCCCWCGDCGGGNLIVWNGWYWFTAGGDNPWTDWVWKIWFCWSVWTGGCWAKLAWPNCSAGNGCDGLNEWSPCWLATDRWKTCCCGCGACCGNCWTNRLLRSNSGCCGNETWLCGCCCATKFGTKFVCVWCCGGCWRKRLIVCVCAAACAGKKFCCGDNW